MTLSLAFWIDRESGPCCSIAAGGDDNGDHEALFLEWFKYVKHRIGDWKEQKNPRIMIAADLGLSKDGKAE